MREQFGVHTIHARYLRYMSVSIRWATTQRAVQRTYSTLIDFFEWSICVWKIDARWTTSPSAYLMDDGCARLTVNQQTFEWRDEFSFCSFSEIVNHFELFRTTETGHILSIVSTSTQTSPNKYWFEFLRNRPSRLHFSSSSSASVYKPKLSPPPPPSPSVSFSCARVREHLKWCFRKRGATHFHTKFRLRCDAEQIFHQKIQYLRDA